MERSSARQLPARLLAAPPAVWAVKHLVSPMDRQLYRLTRGRLLLGRPARDVALLTTTGRRSGMPRTVPVFCLADGERLVVCSVRPAGEPANPWPGNLRADPRCSVEKDGVRREYVALEATAEEVERWWEPLCRRWPPYAAHYRATGQRSIFVLEPARRSGR